MQLPEVYACTETNTQNVRRISCKKKDRGLLWRGTDLRAKFEGIGDALENRLQIMNSHSHTWNFSRQEQAAWISAFSESRLMNTDY